ncbi:MAG: hypothetical protein ACREP7_04705 [Lysobacter sp.]
MKIVIVRDDAIPEALEELFAQSDSGDDYQTMELSRFIALHGLSYDALSGRFLATGADSPAINADLVIDRVVEVTKLTCVAIGGAAPPPFRGQVLQAYESLLTCYRRPQTTGHYSTVGTLVPLFTQWAMVQQTLPWVRVPDYKYGYGPEEVHADDFAQPVYKTPFDFYDWRPNDAPTGIPNDIFVVDRPPGMPMLTFFGGHRVATRSLVDGQRVDPVTMAKLKDVTLLIANRFDAYIGEILWFVDEAKITFAAFSHRLDAAKRFPETAELVAGALTESMTAMPKDG